MVNPVKKIEFRTRLRVSDKDSKYYLHIPEHLYNALDVLGWSNVYLHVTLENKEDKTEDEELIEDFQGTSTSGATRDKWR